MMANNPKFMISAAYPQMAGYFGLVSSFVFSLPYSFLGVWAGIESGRVNRKVFLGLSCILWSATALGMGLMPTFAGFVAFRFLLGCFASGCNPNAYSLIADYFPPQYRSTANAIETSGSYVGGGLSSICVLLIKWYGWRAMYQIIGWLGIGAGVATMLFIKEPERGAFDILELKEPT